MSVLSVQFQCHVSTFSFNVMSLLSLVLMQRPSSPMGSLPQLENTSKENTNVRKVLLNKISFGEITLRKTPKASKNWCCLNVTCVLCDKNFLNPLFGFEIWISYKSQWYWTNKLFIQFFEIISDKYIQVRPFHCQA